MFFDFMLVSQCQRQNLNVKHTSTICRNLRVQLRTKYMNDDIIVNVGNQKLLRIGENARLRAVVLKIEHPRIYHPANVGKAWATSI